MDENERDLAIERLFHQALERAPHERASFLAQACGTDEALRKEVAGLLEAHEQTSDPARPAWADLSGGPQGLLAGSGDLDDVAQTTLEGRRIGDYRVGCVIGWGGMGVVHEAEDTRLGRRVAIKFLPIVDAAFDPRRVERFRREMRTLAGLEHPDIVPVFDAGELEGRPYFVMPFLEGATLAALLEERRAAGKPGVGEPQAVEWMLQVARALAHMHERGIIHRDIKPSNIFVCRPENDARLLDFGLARSEQATHLTRTGQWLGTPSYMSPEQVAKRDDMIGPATDLYTLGATFYETVTLHPPFQVKDQERLTRAVLHEDPPRLRHLAPALSEHFETLLLQCLEKDPKRRPSSAAGLVEDLERLRRGERISARGPSSWRRGSRTLMRILRRPGVRLAAALLLILTVLLAVFGPGKRGGPPPARDHDIFEIVWDRSVIGQYRATRILRAESATGDPVFPSLQGAWVPLGWRTGQKLLAVAQLEPTNDTLEVVLADHRRLGLRAVTAGGPLWDLENDPAGSKAMGDLARQGFQACRIEAFPGLLARDADAIVMVLGREEAPEKGKDGPLSVETAVLIADEQGRLAAKYLSSGALGWYPGTLEVCEVEKCFPGDDAPELVLAGYHIRDPDPLGMVLVVLKPEPIGTRDAAGRPAVCHFARLDLPFFTGYPALDARLAKDRHDEISKGSYGYYFGLALHAEKGRLAWAEISSYGILDYVRYDRTGRRLEWCQADYGDGIRPVMHEYGLEMSDMTFDVSQSPRMQRAAVWSSEGWPE